MLLILFDVLFCSFCLKKKTTYIYKNVIKFIKFIERFLYLETYIFLVYFSYSKVNVYIGTHYARCKTENSCNITVIVQCLAIYILHTTLNLFFIICIKIICMTVNLNVFYSQNYSYIICWMKIKKILLI